MNIRIGPNTLSASDPRSAPCNVAGMSRLSKKLNEISTGGIVLSAAPSMHEFCFDTGGPHAADLMGI